MDSISESRLTKVHPQLAKLVRQMSYALVREGIAIRVVQGFRTWEEQEAIYAQGRTAPGKIVSQAKPGYSYHNFGLAVDVVPMTPLGPDWNVTHPVWGKIVDAGRAQGLAAGAMWRTFKDWPHFQLTGTLPASPTDAVRSAYVTGGLLAVWESTGLVDPNSEQNA